jgi:hypothetical protein
MNIKADSTAQNREVPDALKFLSGNAAEAFLKKTNPIYV